VPGGPFNEVAGVTAVFLAAGVPCLPCRGWGTVPRAPVTASAGAGPGAAAASCTSRCSAAPDGASSAKQHAPGLLCVPPGGTTTGRARSAGTREGTVAAVPAVQKMTTSRPAPQRLCPAQEARCRGRAATRKREGTTSTGVHWSEDAACRVADPEELFADSTALAREWAGGRLFSPLAAQHLALDGQGRRQREHDADGPATQTELPEDPHHRAYWPTSSTGSSRADGDVRHPPGHPRPPQREPSSHRDHRRPGSVRRTRTPIRTNRGVRQRIQSFRLPCQRSRSSARCLGSWSEFRPGRPSEGVRRGAAVVEMSSLETPSRQVGITPLRGPAMKPSDEHESGPAVRWLALRRPVVRHLRDHVATQAAVGWKGPQFSEESGLGAK
jgi:hypothetical protein